jgi:RNA polymerase subunit RPABC4/transcription elongation factor Spt4
MKPEVELSVGISVTNACYQCQLLQDLCVECDDTRQAHDAEIAHQIVDERNLIYPKVWFQVTEPTAHDWVASVTRLPKPARMLDGSLKIDRNEFKEPTTALIDRIFNLDDSLTLERFETICNDCHMVTNKHAVCPNCN